MKHGKIQNNMFMVLLTVLLAVMLYVIDDYLFPIFWAVVFTIMLTPIVGGLQNKFGLKIRSATLVTITTFVIFLGIPIALISGLVVSESISLQQTYISGDFVGQVSKFTQNAESTLGLDFGYVTEKVEGIFISATNSIATSLITWGQNILGIGFSFFIALYTTYFFIVYNTSLKKRLIKLLPFGNDREKELVRKFSDATRATIKGTVLIIVALAIVSFLLFSFLGIPGAILWAGVLGISSIIPVVGTALVWVPMGAILLFLGSVGKGVTVLLFGAIIISNLDNILRPIIVGKDTGLPEVVVLLSTLGGLATFGLTGLILGPVLATLAMVMLEMYESEYGEFLSAEYEK
jgi:predicted PurR-regulated permease PerM